MKFWGSHFKYILLPASGNVGRYFTISPGSLHLQRVFQPDVDLPSTFNPFTYRIWLQILLNAICFLELQFWEFGVISVNIYNYNIIIPWLIIFFILDTYLLHSAMMLQGEIRYYPLLAVRYMYIYHNLLKDISFVLYKN